MVIEETHKSGHFFQSSNEINTAKGRIERNKSTILFYHTALPTSPPKPELELGDMDVNDTTLGNDLSKEEMKLRGS